MTDRVTLFDIAQAAGVSTATVSRVITGRGPVSDEMRRRVEAAAEAQSPHGSAPAVPSPIAVATTAGAA